MTTINVFQTGETSSHPEPTQFLPQTHLRNRTGIRACLAAAAIALPEYRSLAEADAAEQAAWTRWTEARLAHETANSEISFQAAVERCEVSWKDFMIAEARRSAASVAWRHAYRTLPTFHDLLMSTALSCLTSPSTERLAA